MQRIVMQRIAALGLGLCFGIVLVKSEAASWFRIQRMFRFEEAHMYLTMTSAVAIAALSLALIRRLGLRRLDGGELTVRNKQFTSGTVIGGVLFGTGWAITGACPGPIYAQIGSGELLALVSFVGAFAGAYAYALLKPYLAH
jgi:uncharacterized protein